MKKIIVNIEECMMIVNNVMNIVKDVVNNEFCIEYNDFKDERFCLCNDNIIIIDIVKVDNDKDFDIFSENNYFIFEKRIKFNKKNIIEFIKECKKYNVIKVGFSLEYDENKEYDIFGIDCFVI